MNQQEIDILVHGEIIESPKLTDEEVEELSKTLNPNEIYRID